MIPFVAAGGIMIALAFLIGGYQISSVKATDLISGFDPLSGHDWAGLLFVLGGAAFGFLVPVLAGFIAFGIADRPGIAPGFVGGTIAVTVGSGFLGGLVAGFLGGFVALALARLKVPNACAASCPSSSSRSWPRSSPPAPCSSSSDGRSPGSWTNSPPV